jgi:hypothetical protein
MSIILPQINCCVVAVAEIVQIRTIRGILNRPDGVTHQERLMGVTANIFGQHMSEQKNLWSARLVT